MPAWNQAKEEFTDIEPNLMPGKGDGYYSIPFFGHKASMDTDMLLNDESTILKNGYTIISRESSGNA